MAEFVGIKGRVYNEKTVLPVVLSLLARRMRFARAPAAWRAAVRRTMRDPAWLAWREGMCPAGLANDLFSVAIVAWHEDFQARQAPPRKGE